MIYKIIRLVIFFIILSIQIYAQGIWNNWYFGDGASITFQNDTVEVINSNLNFFATEGSASISDENGSLLFYTNGWVIYNSLHDTMMNGDSMYGHVSATQSSLIVPVPEQDSLYYLFTTPGGAGLLGVLFPLCSCFANVGLAYSIIDMRLDGGLGGVTTKNQELYMTPTEKLTAVMHKNERDIWILSHQWGTDTFVAHLLTSAGILSPVKTAIGSVHTGAGTNISAMGYMQGSMDGSKIVIANIELDIFEVFHFNNCTGELSDPITLSSYNLAYGVAFSPSGNRLYGWSGNQIHQFDLSIWNASDIQNSDSILESGVVGLTALMLGPDSNIYVANSTTFENFLGIIENPDALNANYIPDATSLLPQKSRAGLPNNFYYVKYIPDSIKISDTSICVNNTVQFNLTDTVGIDSIIWNYGDGSAIEQSFNPEHIYTQVGNYLVSSIVYKNCAIDTLYSAIRILSNLVFDLGEDPNCLLDSIILQAPISLGSYLWSNGNTTSSIIVKTDALYWLQITDATDCVGVDSIDIKFVLPPNISTSSSKMICTGETIILNAFGADSYAWSPAISLQDSSLSSVVANPTEDITYLVIGYDTCNLSDTASINVELFSCDIYIPNVFSPNNDGKNDGFLIKISETNQFSLEIFDRWGNNVFSTDNSKEVWDGTKGNGMQLNEGVYVYFLQAVLFNGTAYNNVGNITLVR